MQISFIGAGRVGVSLGKYFCEKGRKVGGYYSLSPDSAAWAAEFTNTQQFESLKEVIGSSDMIFFTVPDDRILSVWEEAKPFVSGKIIAHCSGIHSSAIFSDIGRTDSIACSIHPLCAISSKENSWKQLSDVLFTIEGDIEHVSEIKSMFEEMGNRICIIQAKDKIKYHTAASVASNHMVAVFYMAEKLFMECGFSEEEAREELYRLARGNMENIHTQGCVTALTGPIERNDVETVKKHLNTLGEREKRTYLELARWIAELAEEKHPEKSYEAMCKLLHQ